MGVSHFTIRIHSFSCTTLKENTCICEFFYSKTGAEVMENITNIEFEHEKNRRIRNLKIFNLTLESFMVKITPEMKKLYSDYINCRIDIGNYCDRIFELLKNGSGRKYNIEA